MVSKARQYLITSECQLTMRYKVRSGFGNDFFALLATMVGRSSPGILRCEDIRILIKKPCTNVDHRNHGIYVLPIAVRSTGCRSGAEFISDNLKTLSSSSLPCLLLRTDRVT